MKIRVVFAICLAALVVVVLAGCGGGVGDIPKSVATVNGQEISANEFCSNLSAIGGKQVLKTLIERDILLSWADSLGVPVTDDQINARIESEKRLGRYTPMVSQYGEEYVLGQYREMQARSNIQRKIGQKPSEEELKQSYEMFKEQFFVLGERKLVDLIVNPDKKKIEAAKKAIDGGMSVDEAVFKFGSPAFKYSQIIPVKPAKQDNPINATIRKAVKDTGKNDVTAVFEFSEPKSPNKMYAIGVVTDILDKTDVSFKDAKEEILNQMAFERSFSDPDFNKQLEKKRKSAKIEVNDPRFTSVAYEVKFQSPPVNPMMQQPTP